MDTLESSPIEALAINYLSYTFLTAVNSVWTWIAVLTAAVSFWKIGAVKSIKPRGSIRNVTHTPAPIHDEIPTAIAKCEAAPKTTSSASGRILERRDSTKVKFTVTYTEDHADYFQEEADEVPTAISKRQTPLKTRSLCQNERYLQRCDDWEKIAMLKMGNLGLYRCQDLTVLDGNVVRLWDGRSNTSAAW